MVSVTIFLLVIKIVKIVPQAVINLVLSQTYPDDDDDTVRITVSWNEVNYIDDAIINVTLI